MITPFVPCLLAAVGNVPQPNTLIVVLETVDIIEIIGPHEIPLGSHVTTEQLFITKVI